MVKSEGMTKVNSLMEIIEKKDKEIKQLKDKPNNINLDSIKKTHKPGKIVKGMRQ